MRFRLCANIFFLLFFILATGQTIAEDTSSYESKIEHCKSLEDSPVDAIKYANTIIKNLDKNKSPAIYVQFLACLGWALVNDNQLDRSRELAIELEQISINLSDSKEKAQSLRVAGSIFHRLGNRISASENYQQALNIALKLDLKSQLIPLLTNLGVLNSQLQERENAIENFYYALDLMKESNDYKHESQVLFNLAITLNGEKRYKEAKKIFLQVEGTLDDSWSNIRINQLYSGLAVLYLNTHEYQMAKIYTAKAMEILNKMNAKASLKVDNKVIQALIFNSLEQHDQAKEYAFDAYDFYANINSPEDINSIGENLNQLSLILEYYGEFKKALKIIKISQGVKQEYQKSFNKQSMAQMQARLNNIQQREELAFLKHKNEINQLKLDQLKKEDVREIIIWLGIFLIFIVFLLWQREMNKNLKKITLSDSLTNLGNRRAIFDWLNHHPLLPINNRMMWLIDLDYFKRVNDNYGHDAGDMVLIEISKFLMSIGNKHRLIGRWGGEEFMLITDDVEFEDISAFSDKVLKTISGIDFYFKNQKIKITASMGASQILDDSKSVWNECLSKADKALYQAKNNGRNRFVLNI